MIRHLSEEQISKNGADWTCNKCHYGQKNQTCWYLERYDGVNNGFCPALEALMPKERYMREKQMETVKSAKFKQMSSAEVQVAELSGDMQEVISELQLEWYDKIQELDKKEKFKIAVASMAFFGMSVRDMSEVLKTAKSTLQDSINKLKKGYTGVVREKKALERKVERKSDAEIRLESATIAGGEEFAGKRVEQIVYLINLPNKSPVEKYFTNVEYPMMEILNCEDLICSTVFPAGWSVRINNVGKRVPRTV